MSDIKMSTFDSTEITQKKFIHCLSYKLNYIHLNPIRAGWVEKAPHYIYSSASNYVSGKDLLEIELADKPIADTTKINEFG